MDVALLAHNFAKIGFFC